MSKLYRKTYENVFSEDKPEISTRLFIDKVSVDGMEVDEYTKLFKKFLNNFYTQLFDGFVRLSWLRRKFKYYNRKFVLPMTKNSRIHNAAFVKFLRRNIGKDMQIITRGKVFSKIEDYFEGFFPGFMDGNPFENPEYYKFPFKNITLEYLVVVHQVDDRIEILKHADEQNMSFATFCDYAINHIYSYNYENGRDRYQIRFNIDLNYPFHIRDTDKLAKRLKKKKI